MNYDKLIKLATFIPWIIYFVEIMLYRIGVIEKHDLNKEKYFKNMNKNFFSSINMKEVFLFIVFILFLQHENETVLKILFPAIYLYLTIDFFQSLAADCKKIKNKLLMIESVLVLVGIILFFIITNHLFTTYIVMFSISIMSSFIIYIFSWTCNIFKTKKK